MRNTLAATTMLLILITLTSINLGINLLTLTFTNMLIYVSLIVIFAILGFILTVLQDTILLPLLETFAPITVFLIMNWDKISQVNLYSLINPPTIQSIRIELRELISKPLIDVKALSLIFSLILSIVFLIGVIAGVLYKLIIAKIKNTGVEENAITIIRKIRHISIDKPRRKLHIMSNLLTALALYTYTTYMLVRLGLSKLVLTMIPGTPIAILCIIITSYLEFLSLGATTMILITTWFSPLTTIAYLIDTITPRINLMEYKSILKDGVSLGEIKAILSKAKGREYEEIRTVKERTLITSEEKWKWIKISDKYVYNPYKLLNPHVFIAGTSGSGKSFTTALIISKLYEKFKINFLIIDYHGEYMDKMEYIGILKPQHIDASKNTLNILELDNQPPSQRANEIADVLKNIFNLGPLQRIELQKIIEEAYAVAGITEDKNTWNITPSIRHLLIAYNRFLDTIDNEQELRILKSLRPYIQAITTEILSKTTLSLNNILSKPTILDLSRITSEFVKRVYISILLLKIYNNLPYIRTIRTDSLRYIVIDEAHRILSENEVVLSRLFAESRKYNIGLILVTQNPKDVPNAIIANTSLQIILKTIEPSNTEYAAKILGGYSSDERIDTIKRALYYLPRYHGIVKDSLIREPLIVDFTWNKQAGE